MADIGLIGLGTMGANLALNMAENGGATVAVYNRTRARTDAFMAAAGGLTDKLVPCGSLEELIAAIKPPRPVVLMVQAGEAVDQQAEALAPLMSPDDLIIDAGNANFHDTRRRNEVYSNGPRFLGIGVSGGEEGARHGPSIMIGGDPAAYARVEPILTAIAARFDGVACSAHLGPDGAGHFVKTIHNGIEYADMQMIAEVYGVMRDGLGMSSDEMAAVLERWNEGRLKSYLIEITGKVLAARDSDTGRPMSEIILDTAGQKGTGRWSVIEAQDLGVPATMIEAAVAARSLSARRARRLAFAERFGAPAPSLGDALGDRNQALTLLEDALLCGKIAAYAQGFDVLAEASEKYAWNLPFATIARIWRAGCIIRSVFLDDIASAFEASGDSELMLAEPFAGDLQRTESSLRKVTAAAVAAGVPVPALSSALAFFDISRSPTTTANMIQGQRDFFGAHGFERTDREGGDFHGPWAMGLGG